MLEVQKFEFEGAFQENVVEHGNVDQSLAREWNENRKESSEETSKEEDSKYE